MEDQYNRMNKDERVHQVPAYEVYQWWLHQVARFKINHTYNVANNKANKEQYIENYDMFTKHWEHLQMIHQLIMW